MTSTRGQWQMAKASEKVQPVHLAHAKHFSADSKPPDMQTFKPQAARI